MSYLTLHASDVAVLYNKFICNHERPVSGFILALMRYETSLRYSVSVIVRRLKGKKNGEKKIADDSRL